MFWTDRIRAGGNANAKPRSPAPDFRQLLGDAAWARLAEPVRARFAAGSGYGQFSGEADLHANGLGRALAHLLVLFGRPLPTQVGHLESQVHIRTTPVGAVWDRAYRKREGEGRADWEHVRSVKRTHEDALYECAGPIWMRLRLEEREGVLAFISDGFFLALGRFLWRLPDLLTPGRLEVLHIDRGHGRFEFTLTSDHPIFGRLFSQSVRLCDPDMKGA